MARAVLRGITVGLVILLLFPEPRNMIVSFAAHTLMYIVFGILGGLIMLFVTGLSRGRRRR